MTVLEKTSYLLFLLRKHFTLRLKEKVLLLALLFLHFTTISYPSYADGLGIEGVTIKNLPAGGEEIILQLSEAAEFRLLIIENPDRLVIDLPPFVWEARISGLQNYQGTLISNIRYARFDSTTSRIVFDLTQPVAVINHSRMGDGASDKIILSLKPHGMETVMSQAPQSAFEVVPVPMTKPGPLGRWKKPLIVIDAGHGGKDTGAIGGKGTWEKRITLRYARELADALEKTGRFRAKLTRADDRFILLRERVQIARDAGADLFLSIHADSAPNIQARGLSVYTLSEEASDKEAAALAERENKAGIIQGFDLTHQNKDVANILIDLAQRDTKNKSITLADMIVEGMKRPVRLLPNTHRYAGFAVLTAPDIPSALIEVGFLSHPQEEYTIQLPNYRQKVIEGIIRGIERYFTAQMRNESL